MTVIRRFLLAPAFARLVRKERGSARVTEGYFPTQSGRNSHVLVEAGQCHLVLVTPEDGAVSEERTEVPRAHADALLDVCGGKAVYERTRVALPGGREALVDRITQPGALDLVSVEFESRDEAAAFHAPDWFGPEVTAEAAFDRRAIALEGLPAVGEVPLSNAALEALLDVLEDRFGRATRFASTAAATPAPATARRSATDGSVIDALRRLATPGETAAANTVEPVQAAEPAPHAAGLDAAEADARIDDVIASLSQALGTASEAPGAEEPAQAMPDVERPVARIRRLGA
jgi:CYTH domain-containing protein